MLVYRICKKEEIVKIFNGKDFNKIGNVCEKNIRKNTHKYVDDIRYVHFFRNKLSMFYLDSLEDMYICTYDICDRILKECVGVGFYLDAINVKKEVIVDEFAIPSKLIELENLVKVEKIQHPICFEDFINDENLEGLVEVIYIKPNQKKHKNKVKRLHRGIHE